MNKAITKELSKEDMISYIENNFKGIAQMQIVGAVKYGLNKIGSFYGWNMFDENNQKYRIVKTAENGYVYEKVS